MEGGNAHLAQQAREVGAPQGVREATSARATDERRALGGKASKLARPTRLATLTQAAAAARVLCSVSHNTTGATRLSQDPMRRLTIVKKNDANVTFTSR